MNRNDPFESMDRLFEQMRRSSSMMNLDAGRRGMDAGRRPMFHSDGSDELAAGGDVAPVTWDDSGLGTRNVRLEPTDEGYVAVADLPGFETEEITVSLDDGTLSIVASHEADEDDGTSVRRRTRRVSESLTVPGPVDVDAVDGSYRNGVLEISLPTLAEDDDAHVIDLD